MISRIKRISKTIDRHCPAVLQDLLFPAWTGFPLLLLLSLVSPASERLGNGSVVDDAAKALTLVGLVFSTMSLTGASFPRRSDSLTGVKGDLLVWVPYIAVGILVDLLIC